MINPQDCYVSPENIFTKKKNINLWLGRCKRYPLATLDDTYISPMTNVK